MTHGSDNYGSEDSRRNAVEVELLMKEWMETHPSSNVLIVWVVDEGSEVLKKRHQFYKVYCSIYK